VYKVVERVGYGSAARLFSPLVPKEAKVEFKLHQPATPRPFCGPITVFYSVEDAREFCSHLRAMYPNRQFFVYNTCYQPVESDYFDPWLPGGEVLPGFDWDVHTLASEVMLCQQV